MWLPWLLAPLLAGAVTFQEVPVDPPATACVFSSPIPNYDCDTYLGVWNAPSLAFAPSTADESTKCVVHLTSKETMPNASIDGFLSTLASQDSTHVLALSYMSPPFGWQGDFSKDCAVRGSKISECVAEVMQALFEGDMSTDIFQVPENQSFIWRLVRSFQFLNESAPEAGWDRYIQRVNDEITPNWEMLTISGFNQGAGLASWIAYQKPCANAWLFEGPNLWMAGTGYFAEPWATNASDVTAVYHCNGPSRNTLDDGLDLLGHLAPLRLEPGNLQEITSNLSVSVGTTVEVCGDPVENCADRSVTASNSVLLDACTPENTNTESGSMYGPLWRCLLQGSSAGINDPPLPPLSALMAKYSDTGVVIGLLIACMVAAGATATLSYWYWLSTQNSTKLYQHASRSAPFPDRTSTQQLTFTRANHSESFLLDPSVSSTRDAVPIGAYSFNNTDNSR